MRSILFFIIASLILTGCSGNSGSGKSSEKNLRKLREQAVSIAEKYAMDQLQTTNKTSDAKGIIIISNEHKRFIIDPARIITGLVDDDKSIDAIFPVFPFEGEYEVMTHHLIMTEKDGRLRLERALETDMKVLSVKDGIITADVPEHSRNNPLFNCSSCWEVVKYRFIKGELVKIE